MITSVEPATVQRGGGTFLIRGTRMYPGIVTNVLLGGDALPTSNFVPISDTENQGRGNEQPEDRYECSSGKYVVQWDCSDVEHQRQGEREIAVA